jgi:hypothetical protein
MKFNDLSPKDQHSILLLALTMFESKPLTEEGCKLKVKLEWMLAGLEIATESA